MFAPLLALAVLAQAEEPAKPAPVKVHLATETRGATLVERASKKVLCAAPCGQLLEREKGAEYLLLAPGVLDSDAFSLEGAADEVTVRWHPATSATRVFGVGLTVLGGVAVLAAIAIGVTAMVMGIVCSANGTACPSFGFAWSTLPLAVGGYVVLGVGMTLMFRFGVERLEIEAGR
jgi:hypothetical protein